ncbi:thyroid receptor-interacting protein 11-like isoform X1 [Haliotis cracherodii]|uniref:thyroid receptor-interacting protein 11-like isoform X1 n=1 Tax=Haliotis cracherodii TaxID=6455 RepID=UPI0039EBEE76
MSWLGGSISSLTGQISNLTKDILTEGTEEVSDHATELRLAQEKIAEFQTLCGALKTENDRLKIFNRELEEKAESSELQINSISSQYRDVLQEKENDLKELKKKHNEILEHQARSALSPLTAPSTAHVPAPSQPGSLSTQTGLGFSEGVGGSEWDLGDNISLQHEINRLRQEATRLQTEAQHWKSVAGQLSQTGTSNEQFEASNAEIIQLRDRAKELEHQLVQARDHQQHEVVSLQDVHTDKMAAIKKKHKQEVADFKRQIAALEQQLSESRDNDSVRHGSSNLPEADRAGLSSESDVHDLRRELQDLHTQLSKVNTEKNKIETAKRHLEGVLEELQTEVGKLQDERDSYVEKITLLDSTVADQRAELETLKQAAGDDVVQLKQALEQALSEKSSLEKEVGQVGLSLFDAKQRLLEQLDANHADALEVLSDLQHVRHQMDNDSAGRRNRLLNEKQKLANQIYVLGQKQGQVKSNLVEVKSLSTHLTTEAAAIVESLGSPGHQQVTAELVASLEKENLYLREQNLKCQEQITLLERAATTQAQERSRCEDTISRLKGQLQDDVDESSSVSTLNDSLSTGSVRTVDGSDISELSRRNRELDLKVEQLQTEVDKYKTDIDQFEFVKSDWQLEKESLEEVLLQLRKQLQEKEMELNIALAQKGLAEVKRQEKKSQAVERTQTGEVVEETIVAEHQDLLQTGETTLEADIETFAAQAQKLSDANLQLEEERDQLEADKVALEEKIKRLENNVSTLEKSLQSEKQASPQQQQQQLEQRVQQHEVEMKAMEQEKLDLESSLEELDQQHQQAMDKLISIRDDLSQQVDTLNTSLSLKDTEIVNLTEELDKSRAQIEEAASSSKDLTDAAEGPDEALVEELQAKLEKMESDKAKEIQDLKEKCQNAAVAVNDLHMDKRELQEELGRVKQEITGKVAKLKEMREDHTRLVEENKDLRERLQEAEDEIEDWQERNEQTQVHNSQKEAVSKEMEELQNEISELRSKLDEYYTACEHEKTRCSQLLAENQRLSVQTEQFEVQKQESTRQASQPLHDRISVLETQFDAVNLDKVNLEKEISQLEDKLHAQTKHYESYIQELQSSQDKDATALQQDHQAMMQTCHEKELAISDLQSQINSLKSELDMTKDTMQTSVDSQLQLTSILKEKDDEISSLKSANIELNSEYEELCAHLKEQEVLMESMKGMEKLLADSKEEIQRLRTEIEVNKMNMEQQKPDEMDQQKTLEIITELEKELASCKDKIFRLEETVHSQESLINDHKAGITQLNEKHEGYIREIEEERVKLARQDDLILILQEKSADKDEEIADLKYKLTRASSLVDAKKLQLLNEGDSQPGLPALEYPEKAAIEYTSPSRKWDEEEFVDKDDFDGDTSNKIEMISKEIGELQLRLQEKDLVIQELQSNNASLLTMLEAKSLTSHGDKSLVSVHKLENEVKALKMEREQIMAVMTEKSRESSSLKAEVHRLMSVVTAEKSALNKLQEDNHQLQNRENPVDDMQREALQNLSRLVRDREMEIEALKQKNDTLLAVLQDSSQETQGTQINSLLQDKDNLSKQMMTFQAEREQMITYLNQKHQESVTYHNEIQRLTALVSTQTEQFEALNRNYTNLVPQFEDKTQTLLKTQNELLNYKQKYNELEVKYGELLGRSNMSETVDMATYNTKMVELQKCQDRLSELQQEINDRDLKIQGLSSKIHELESVVSSKEAERTSFKKQADNLTFQLQGLQTELQDFRTESVSTKQKSSEIDSELQVLKDSNNQLTLSLREKEFELTSLREKTGTLTTLLQQQQGEQGQVDHLVQENASLHQQTVQYQQERDQTIMALRQKHTDVEELNKEIARLKEKEMKLSRELERLRQHLLQIEEGYTGEALEAEEREKELRNRLAVAEEKILSSSSAVQNASQAASEQVETLQHQLHGVTSQRDAAYMQMTAMQDQCQQYAASLANLQMVLEQFQQDKDAQIAADTERYQDEIKLLKDKVNTLQRALDSTKTELEEASDGLEAASRLSEQLDKKEEAVAALKEEVLLREKTLKAAEEEVRKLTTSTEAKVDKLLMKNMLIGYFQTPTGRRNEVIHMMGGVLNFQLDDYAKINQTQTSWVAGFLRFGSPRAGPTPPTTPVHAGSKAPSLDQSFSQLFVKFLEKESSPPPPPVRMPAEKMAQEVKDKHKESQKPVFNPFTAPRHVSMPLQLGEQTATTKPHILMGPMSPVTQTNPLMAPMSGESLSQPGSGRSTPQNSSAILKDVLGTR